MEKLTILKTLASEYRSEQAFLEGHLGIFVKGFKTCPLFEPAIPVLVKRSKEMTAQVFEDAGTVRGVFLLLNKSHI